MMTPELVDFILRCFKTYHNSARGTESFRVEIQAQIEKFANRMYDTGYEAALDQRSEKPFYTAALPEKEEGGEWV